MSEKKIAGHLKTGFTTGTCAAAAARCACIVLIEGNKNNPKNITVTLPRGGQYGDTATLPVHRSGIINGSDIAFCEIIKDAGDDPDVTNGAIIRAEISWINNGEPRHIEIVGGTGVGIVTKTGLPVAVGEPAINPVPRKMITHEINDVLSRYKINRAIKVIISVPDGEQIARLTMNARLGITGGISILGTRGIVIPFSSAAYRASLAVTIKAAAENGIGHLVLTTGGRSEKYAMELYPELTPMSFIEAGEFIGFSLKKCETYKIKKMTLSGMIGKLSKVAAGVLMVHSSKSSIDFSFLANIAAEAGAGNKLVEKIKQANTAGEVAGWMKVEGLMEFFNILTRYCCKVCSEKVQGQMEIETLLFTLDGELLSRSHLPCISGQT